MVQEIKDLSVKEPNVLQKVLKVLAYPIAAATGVFYGHKYARNATFDALKKQGKLDAAEGNLKNAFKTAENDLPTIPKAMGEMNNKYADEATRVFRAHHFNNTFDYVRSLSDMQKFEAGAAAIGAATVALGVALTIAENRSLTEKLLPTGNNKNTQR